MIYLELDKRNEKRMGRVIKWGSFVAVSFYCLVGVFGYATFVNDEGQLYTKNILQANY